MTRTLLLILAFLILMIGSFIWFVATWQPSEREPITSLAAPFEVTA